MTFFFLSHSSPPSTNHVVIWRPSSCQLINHKHNINHNHNNNNNNNTATQTRPTTSTTTHGLITMPLHAAELVVPSTTSLEPPTIGFLLIGLQWWVLPLGLFDLVVFFAVPISLVVFFFFFLIEVALVDMGLCRWWLSVLLQQWWLWHCCWGWGW